MRINTFFKPFIGKIFYSAFCGNGGVALKNDLWKLASFFVAFWKISNSHSIALYYYHRQFFMCIVIKTILNIEWKQSGWFG